MRKPFLEQQLRPRRRELLRLRIVLRRFQIEAPDETGQVVRWSIEWGGSGQLTGQGVTRTTLKYGDVVLITANPSRTPNDHKLHMLTLHRKSDGFGWGTRPGEVTD